MMRGAVLTLCVLGTLIVERRGMWAAPSAGVSPSSMSSGAAICVGDASHGWLAQGNRVLLTADGGRTWKLSFQGRFERASEFRASIGCSGETAWALFVGPGAAMNQKPYILYRTDDGGARWDAESEEGYFGSMYPDAHVQRTLGAYPGPFVVLSRTAAYFLGSTLPVGPQGTVYLSGTSDAGRSWRKGAVPCLSAVHPFTLAFTSVRHGWIVGVCNGRSMSLVTDDGGRTWSRHPIAVGNS